MGNMIIDPDYPFIAYAWAGPPPPCVYHRRPECRQRVAEKLNVNGLLDYNVSYQDGTLTIVPASVGVVVDNQAITYGTPTASLPQLTWHAYGMVGNESITSIISSWSPVVQGATVPVVNGTQVLGMPTRGSIPSARRYGE